MKRFLEYNHPLEIIKSGAMDSATSTGGFRDLLNRCLNNPEINSEARKNMLNKYVGQLDGLSGKKVADFILFLL